jgi:flagellar biosynthesis protein FlhF
MNVMRFVGRTSGEAMRKLRDALGPDALVLANRPCADGIELLAAAPGMLGALESQADRPVAQGSAARARPADRPAAPSAQAARDLRDGVGGEGAPAVPMSTVSFQDYVRQRLRERSQAGLRADEAEHGLEPEPRAAALRGSADRAASVGAGRAGTVREVAAAPARPAPARPPIVRNEARGAEPVRELAGSHGEFRDPPAASTRPTAASPRPAGEAAAARRAPTLDGPGMPRGLADGFGRPGAAVPDDLRSRGEAPAADAVRPVPMHAGPAPGDALVAELQSLKGMISRQFATISWFEGVRRSPTQGRLLRSMVAAGFSLKLARSVVTRLPSDYSERDALIWLEEVLARNLRCAAPAESFEAGGVFALVGPTGVGKTTTTAKIAARHVLQHGPQSVALITVDTYRLGAHDQLRAFGRILGVPVHIAHDASALHDLLRLRGTRQLVLVDTVGMGHHDERIRSLLLSLPRSDIRHVVVASCAAQAETIDASLRAYEARQAHGVVLTKLDEAARTGGALDCVLRQRLRLLGVCDGQRVPEDWQPADAGRLVRRALLAPPTGAFALDDEELPLVFGVAATLQGEAAHA